MSEKKDVTVKIYPENQFWRFELDFGDYREIGSGITMEEVEQKAIDILNKLKNVGVVHNVYPNGKIPTIKAEMV
jgi:hypothetical protein